MNSKFIIGRYIYCTQERFLYLDGESINIEPKMADVLDYLLLNTERYVPLQELHDEVWVGRIVTDTAVRRVVSRLRALIEADPSQPEIIKSLPKRGYRLFSMPASAEFASKHLEASPVEAPIYTSSVEQVTNTLDTNQAAMAQESSLVESSLTTPINDVDTDVTEPIKPSTVEKKDAKEVISFPAEKNNYKGLMLIIGLVLLCCLGAFYFLKQPNNLEPHVNKLEGEPQTTELVLSHFDSLPLNSRLLSISKSGELAIYEQEREDGSFELFLHKIQQGKQWLLAVNHISVGYAAFVEKDKALLLSFNAGSPIGGSMQLWHLNKTNQVSSKRVLVSDIQGATSVVSGDKANSAFIAIASVEAKNKYEFSRISWDKEKSVVQEKTTSSNNNQSMDIQGALSADNQYLAYVRRTRLDHEQEIQILELATGKITKRIPWRQETRALTWQDSKTLLVLNKQNLTSINLVTDRNLELFVNLDGDYWNMYFFDKKIYLYKRKYYHRRYIELVSTNGKYHTLHRERDNNSVSVHISKYNKLWYEVTKEGDEYHLSLIDLDNPEKDKQIFSADEYFTMLDESKHGELLIKVGDRVGVLKPNGKINFINTEQQMLDDAVFDRGGVNIIYSMFNNNKWTINFLDVALMKSTLIMEGFISVRVTDEFYFFWSEDNELFKAENLTSVLTPLSVKGSFLQPPSWKAVYPNIYWIDFDTNKLVINKFNIVELDKQVIDINLTRGFYFSVNESDNIFLERANDRSSVIYEIDGVEN